MIRKFLLKSLCKYTPKWVVLCIDVLLVCGAFIVAYWIRFNISFNFDTTNLIAQLLVVMGASIISFLLVGSYKGVIRHTGIRDTFNVFLGVSIYILLIGLIILLNQSFEIYKGFTIPKSIILIHYLVAVFLLIISRCIFKAFYKVISTELNNITKVLIYGAGDFGMVTYRALDIERGTNYHVLGFIDDDKNKINKTIDRLKVYDPSTIDEAFIRKNNIDEVIISIQNIKPKRLLEITDILLKLGVVVKIVPPLTKWIEGGFQANQIKQINIDDLLGREIISIKNPVVKREVANKVVLVTGAAGSIGSELAKQLASYNLELLILIDQSESALYDLQQELIMNGKSNFKTIVGDVRDLKKMEEVFATYKPEKVFHAAAYKHIPLMEENPYEAVRINVFGTKNIADLSLKYKVERFVMVSTDKAVNPTNVMGATKRVAEIYISCLCNEQSATKFTITRFGNVLGSNGSLIPLFKKQIKNGGPLTVTHKNITRYFMTIPEACRLILEAGTMGNGGEIYLFDMGNSVNIFDMAIRMISLSGLRYPDDIDIKITGLRPGEKLYEELLVDGEKTTKTYHEKIRIAKFLEIDTFEVKKQIVKLCIKNNNLTNQEIVEIMKQIVPEYISNNSVYQILDTIAK